MPGIPQPKSAQPKIKVLNVAKCTAQKTPKALDKHANDRDKSLPITSDSFCQIKTDGVAEIPTVNHT